MIDTGAQKPSSRAWVLFDGSPGSQAALLQALPFIRSNGMELRVVYVEDQALINCSALAVSQEVGAVSGRLRSHTLESYSYAHSARLQRAQQALNQLLEQQAMDAALESYRGSPIQILQDLVAVSDWVVLGRGGFANWQVGRMGGLAQCVIEQVSSTILVGSPSGAVRGGPWLALLDSLVDLESYLDQARSITRSIGVELVFVGALELAKADVTTSAPSTFWGDHGGAEGVEYINREIAGPLALQNLVQEYQAGGLIASVSSRLFKRGLTAGWMKNVDRPLLLLNEA